MEITNPQISSLFDSLNSRNERKREAASQFPTTKEEYLELDTANRMQVAKALMQRYADVSNTDGRRINPSSSKFATARFDLEAGRAVEARVGFTESEPLRSGRTYPEVPVWARGLGSTEEETGEIDSIGVVIFEQNRFFGVPIEPPFVVQEGEAFSVSDERARLVIEMVDAAACNLIDGVVARHRQLGSRMLVETIQDKVRNF